MTMQSPSSDQVPKYGGPVHTHRYDDSDVTHSHDSDHYPRGGSPRTDGSEPAPADPLPVQHLARWLGVYEDAEGYVWIKVGPDHFDCLDTPLLRAIGDKWTPVSKAAAEEVGRELIRMEASRG